jgi:predicted TIM-barrel fold metal-dependent hydrolase
MPTTERPADGWDCHVHVFDAEAPVRPGHYRPVHRPLHEIEAIAAGEGIGHLVLVQPSVYGHDNTVLLRALQTQPGRHRGVAVVDTSVDDVQLDRLHAAGVRGIRFNLVSPAGHVGDAAADLHRLAPRLRERGWHVQWYVPAEGLQRLVALQEETGLRFVLDHLAGLHAGLAGVDPAWAAARALAEAGAWVKLSGWYRLGAAAPYADLQPVLQRVIAMFGPRLVWGSDWPHTSFAPDRLPGYASTLFPVREALHDGAVAAILGDHARLLYLDKAVSP